MSTKFHHLRVPENLIVFAFFIGQSDQGLRLVGLQNDNDALNLRRDPRFWSIFGGSFSFVSEEVGLDWQKLYRSWEDNPDVGFIALKGSGKAFCAGGDMVCLYHFSNKNEKKELNSHHYEAMEEMRTQKEPKLIGWNWQENISRDELSLDLKECRKEDILVTLWGDISCSLDIEAITTTPPPALTVFTSLKLKQYQNKVSLSSTGSTFYILNLDKVSL